MGGVLAVLTHDNTPRLAPAKTVSCWRRGAGTYPAADDRVRFSGQPIALVVAETFEQATDAASQFKVSYKTAPFVADDADPDARTIGMDEIGDAGRASRAAVLPR